MANRYETFGDIETVAPKAEETTSASKTSASVTKLNRAFAVLLATAAMTAAGCDKQEPPQVNFNKGAFTVNIGKDGTATVTQNNTAETGSTVAPTVDSKGAEIQSETTVGPAADTINDNEKSVDPAKTDDKPADTNNDKTVDKTKATVTTEAKPTEAPGATGEACRHDVPVRIMERLRDKKRMPNSSAIRKMVKEERKCMIEAGELQPGEPRFEARLYGLYESKICSERPGIAKPPCTDEAIDSKTEGQMTLAEANILKFIVAKGRRIGVNGSETIGMLPNEIAKRYPVDPSGEDLAIMGAVMRNYYRTQKRRPKAAKVAKVAKKTPNTGCEGVDCNKKWKVPHRGTSKMPR